MTGIDQAIAEIPQIVRLLIGLPLFAGAVALVLARWRSVTDG